MSIIQTLTAGHSRHTGLAILLILDLYCWDERFLIWIRHWTKGRFMKTIMHIIGKWLWIRYIFVLPHRRRMNSRSWIVLHVNIIMVIKIIFIRLFRRGIGHINCIVVLLTNLLCKYFLLLVLISRRRIQCSWISLVVLALIIYVCIWKLPQYSLMTYIFLPIVIHILRFIHFKWYLAHIAWLTRIFYYTSCVMWYIIFCTFYFIGLLCS